MTNTADHISPTSSLRSVDLTPRTSPIPTTFTPEAPSQPISDHKVCFYPLSWKQRLGLAVISFVGGLLVMNFLPHIAAITVTVIVTLIAIAWLTSLLLTRRPLRYAALETTVGLITVWLCLSLVNPVAAILYGAAGGFFASSSIEGRRETQREQRR